MCSACITEAIRTSKFRNKFSSRLFYHHFYTSFNSQFCTYKTCPHSVKIYNTNCLKQHVPPQKRYTPNTPSIEKGVAAPCKTLLLHRYTWVFLCTLPSDPPEEELRAFCMDIPKEITRWFFEQQRLHVSDQEPCNVQKLLGCPQERAASALHSLQQNHVRHTRLLLPRLLGCVWLLWRSLSSQ